MKSIVAKFNIKSIWHFTDQSNIESIKTLRGLYSLIELQKKGVAIPAPGGNQWSHDADVLKDVHKYVHLTFLDDHPMLYMAKQDGRIKTPTWLRIDPSVLLDTNVRFTKDVSNKAGVEILTPAEAAEQIDFEVLFTYMDWKIPEVKVRRQLALKSEILIPNFLPLEKILSKKYG